LRAAIRAPRPTIEEDDHIRATKVARYRERSAPDDVDDEIGKKFSVV